MDGNNTPERSKYVFSPMKPRIVNSVQRDLLCIYISRGNDIILPQIFNTFIPNVTPYLENTREAYF